MISGLLQLSKSKCGRDNEAGTENKGGHLPGLPNAELSSPVGIQGILVLQSKVTMLHSCIKYPIHTNSSCSLVT